MNVCDKTKSPAVHRVCLQPGRLRVPVFTCTIVVGSCPKVGDIFLGSKIVGIEKFAIKREMGEGDTIGVLLEEAPCMTVRSTE